MAKQVILAVAGAGKTYHICHCINAEEKNLILAFTKENIKNIIKELVDAFGSVPLKTKVLTFHSFIYGYCLLPFEPTILKYWQKENFSSQGVSLKEPPSQTIKKGGKVIPNKKYVNKNEFEHYVDRNRQYYCDNISELLLNSKDANGKKILVRIAEKMNSFFDNVLIDEFQDFRKNDHELIVQLSKKIDNILFVGDYYQHSVSGRNNSGKPFDNCSYEEFIVKMKSLKFDVDPNSLKASRRCPPQICEFIREKLKISMDCNSKNTGDVYSVDEQNITDILKDNTIMKLLLRESNKYNFKSMNWGYSKGDTFPNVCVILTEPFKNIMSDSFSLTSKHSAETINKLYVALSRTKGNLYILTKEQFDKHKSKYIIRGGNI